MAKKKEIFEEVFKKAFYGRHKIHISNSYIANGKIVVQSLCGRNQSKFLTSKDNNPTCKNCLKVAHKKGS